VGPLKKKIKPSAKKPQIDPFPIKRSAVSSKPPPTTVVSLHPSSLILRYDISYLDSKLPLREMSRPLLRLLQDLAAFVLAQTSSDGASLLGSEIEGEVFLALVKEAKLGALVGVDDG
jgi:hypothetical protein